MGFLTGPPWSFKDLVTSSKLAQMVENLRSHNHESGGTQGVPIGQIAGFSWFGSAATIGSGVSGTNLGSITVPANPSPGKLLYAALLVQTTPGSAVAGSVAVALSGAGTGQWSGVLDTLRHPYAANNAAQTQQYLVALTPQSSSWSLGAAGANQGASVALRVGAAILSL